MRSYRECIYFSFFLRRQGKKKIYEQAAKDQEGVKAEYKWDSSRRAGRTPTLMVTALLQCCFNTDTKLLDVSLYY